MGTVRGSSYRQSGSSFFTVTYRPISATKCCLVWGHLGGLMGQSTLSTKKMPVTATKYSKLFSYILNCFPKLISGCWNSALRRIYP